MKGVEPIVSPRTQVIDGARILLNRHRAREGFLYYPFVANHARWPSTEHSGRPESSSSTASICVSPTPVSRGRPMQPALSIRLRRSRCSPMPCWPGGRLAGTARGADGPESLRRAAVKIREEMVGRNKAILGALPDGARDIPEPGDREHRGRVVLGVAHRAHRGPQTHLLEAAVEGTSFAGISSLMVRPTTLQRKTSRPSPDGSCRSWRPPPADLLGSVDRVAVVAGQDLEMKRMGYESSSGAYCVIRVFTKGAP